MKGKLRFLFEHNQSQTRLSLQQSHPDTQTDDAAADDCAVHFHLITSDSSIGESAFEWTIDNDHFAVVDQ